MRAKIKEGKGRPAMKEKDKKQAVTCMLSPNTVTRLKIDTLNGKAQTPNQRMAQIVELYYKNKDKKAKSA